MVQNDSLKPDDYGITVIPLDGAPTPASSAAAPSPRSTSSPTEAERDAAVKWIDFYYIQKLLTQEGAVADAEALTANNQPVGVPALPIFDKATYDESQAWIKDYINVPTDQMTPFTSKIFDQPLVNEPVAHTQELYAALDPVVQAVLTDKNADIDALLDAANAAGPGHPRRGLSPARPRAGPGAAGARPPRHRSPDRHPDRPPSEPTRRSGDMGSITERRPGAGARRAPPARPAPRHAATA